MGKKTDLKTGTSVSGDFGTQKVIELLQESRGFLMCNIFTDGKQRCIIIMVFYRSIAIWLGFAWLVSHHGRYL